MVFGNTNDGQGYDLVLLGQVEPTKIDVDEIQAKLQRPEYAPVGAVARARSASTRPSICSRPMPARKPDLQPWLRDAPINRDRNLRLQTSPASG